MPRGDGDPLLIIFATTPGFHPTLCATTGSHAPTGLNDIRVPVRICFGTEDAMLGALTAPRSAAAIPGAQLIPLAGCGPVPMADNLDLVAKAISDLTLVSGPQPG
jgi:pimeloyl-ACP methyl ester carboxylesterase